MHKRPQRKERVQEKFESTFFDGNVLLCVILVPVIEIRDEVYIEGDGMGMSMHANGSREWGSGNYERNATNSLSVIHVTLEVFIQQQKYMI